MADQEIKTSIDGLVAYLNEHGETNTSVVASALGVGESTIIEWSNILEKASMIRIVHKSGRMFLSPLRGGGASAATTKSNEDSDQAHFQTEIASQVAVVNQISAKIEQFNRSITVIDDLFKTRYKNVKPFLDKINAVQNKVDGYEKRMTTKAKQIEDLESTMQKEFDALQRYSASLSGFSVDTNNARGVSDEMKGRLVAYQANMDEMSRSLDQLIYKYRKNALEMHKEIREKGEQLRQIVGLEEKQIYEYERTAKDYKRDSESVIRKAEQKRKAAIDELDKTRQEVRRLNDSAAKDLENLKASVEELKKGLGGISVLNEDLVAMKKGLGEATEEKNALLKDLNTMMQNVKTISAVRKTNEKQTKEKTIKTDTQKLAQRVDALNQSTEKIGQEFRQLGVPAPSDKPDDNAQDNSPDANVENKK